MFNIGYMYEYGLGLPQDFHLARRHYHESYQTDSDAFVPAYIAMTKLHLHTQYIWARKKWDEWRNTIDIETKSDDTSMKSDKQKSQKSEKSKPSLFEGFSEFISPEDAETFLLLFLCSALAIIVYYRAQI